MYEGGNYSKTIVDLNLYKPFSKVKSFYFPHLGPPLG